MNSGIYKITCTANGKVYIGSAVDFGNRKRQHFHALRHNKHKNKHLQNAYNKYGEASFIFRVVEYCSPETLIEREQYYIDLYDVVNSGFNLNPLAGSSLGIVRSEETRQRISESGIGRKHTDEAKQKISEAGKNRVVSQETREKIRKTLTGKKRPQETIDKMRAAMRGKMVGELNPNYGKTISDEQKKRISETHKGKRLSFSRRQKMWKPVQMLDKDTNRILAIYPSISEASYRTGIDVQHISRVCLGGRKSVGGYVWRYIE